MVFLAQKVVSIKMVDWYQIYCFFLSLGIIPLKIFKSAWIRFFWSLIKSEVVNHSHFIRLNEAFAGNIELYSAVLFVYCRILESIEIKGRINTKRIKKTESKYFELFHDKGPYHIETSPWICSASQWTGFYMVETSVMKELKSTKFCKATWKS